MIYSDGVHLISDQGLDDLHRYAESIGIKRCWFHNTPRFPHYDIPKGKRPGFFTRYVDVRQVTSREIVAILKRST